MAVWPAPDCQQWGRGKSWGKGGGYRVEEGDDHRHVSTCNTNPGQLFGIRAAFRDSSLLTFKPAAEKLAAVHILEVQWTVTI